MLGCSTPEGIEGGRTRPVVIPTKGQLMCSTPEGIEGGRTLPWGELPPEALLCSTPEGIEGGRTPFERAGRHAHEVLNARGHRRGSHMAPMVCCCSAADGAQRPRASKGVARRFASRRAVALHVLNARGHRRGSHTRAGCKICAARATCSTPEGIEGGRTCSKRFNGGFNRCAQRPRASKGVARTKSGALFTALSCSTPEGIEGGRTLFRGQWTSRRAGAQRPRASKGVAPSRATCPTRAT